MAPKLALLFNNNINNNNNWLYIINNKINLGRLRFIFTINERTPVIRLYEYKEFGSNVTEGENIHISK